MTTPEPIEDHELADEFVKIVAEGEWARARKRLGLAPEFLPHSRSDFRTIARSRILTALRRPSPIAESTPSIRDAVADSEEVDEFIEEWTDCGNLGWCRSSAGKCTRHNDDEYRKALKSLRTANTGRDEVLEEARRKLEQKLGKGEFYAQGDRFELVFRPGGGCFAGLDQVVAKMACGETAHWLPGLVAQLLNAALSSPPVTTVAEEGWIERSAFNDMAMFAADERDRTILLSELLKEARWYVNDSLEAHEHSDGRELLNRIDAALAQPTPTGGQEV